MMFFFQKKHWNKKDDIQLGCEKNLMTRRVLTFENQL